MTLTGLGLWAKEAKRGWRGKKGWKPPKNREGEWKSLLRQKFGILPSQVRNFPKVSNLKKFSPAEPINPTGPSDHVYYIKTYIYCRYWSKFGNKWYKISREYHLRIYSISSADKQFWCKKIISFNINVQSLEQ